MIAVSQRIRLYVGVEISFDLYLDGVLLSSFCDERKKPVLA